MKKLLQNKSFLCTLIMMHTVFMLSAQTSNPVGAIPGVIDVSPMGAATYTIPIEAVPGTQGMQPNLSIVYNSFGGMGLLGMKWNLSGVSAITRCGQTPYFDGTKNPIPIQFNINRFTLDGERLINIGGQQTNFIYAAEVENFTRIYPGNGHSSFTAYTDDGSIVKYGSADNSRQLMGTTANILSWLVDTVTDFNGNRMIFSYDKPHNDEEVLISKIEYTGNAKNSMPPFAHVSFSYRDLPDMLGQNTYFVAGYKVQQTRLLDAITVYYGTEPVRTYRFIYNIDDAGARTAHLKEIVLYSEGGKQPLNATAIKWNSQSSVTEKQQLSSDFSEGYILTGDFNGDGYMDYVIYGQTSSQDTWKFYAGKPDGTFEDTGTSGKHKSVSNEKNCYFYKADLNGDGCDELIIAEVEDLVLKHYCFRFLSLERGAFEITRKTIQNFEQLFFGDFDGNGKTDILFVKIDPNDSDKKCSFQLCNNFNFTNLASLYQYSACRVRVGDFTGNGKTDVELHFPWGQVETYYYHTNGNFYKIFDSPRTDYCYDRYSGDFNGDGITDLLTYEHTQAGGLNWKLYFGKGNGNYTASTTITDLDVNYETLTNGLIVPLGKIMIADLDGDGKDDIIQLTAGFKTVLYSKGCINEQYKYKPEKISITGNNLLLPKTYNIADFNNDGIPDLIVQGNRGDIPVVFYLHKNKQYDSPQEITDGMGKIIKLTFKPKYLPANQFNLSQSITKKYFHYLLDKMEVSNGLSTLNSFLYQYDKPVFSMSRLSFLGFKEFVCKNVEENKQDDFQYEMLTWGSGTLSSKEVLKPFRHTVSYNSIVYSVTDYDIYLLNFHLDRYITYTRNLTIANKIFWITIKTTDILNETGRLIKTDTYTQVKKNRQSDMETILTEKKTYTYKTINLSVNQEKTVPDKIITTQQYGDNTNATVLADTLTCNYFETGTHKGRLNWERKGNSDGSITTKYNSYSSAGACLSKTVSAAGCDSRTENYVYDNTQRFVKEITNPVGHITDIIYDGKTGNKTSETDPNGLITTYKYDTFGNLTQTNYPDDTQTHISMKWNTDANLPNAKYYTTTSTSGKADLMVYYDILNREVCRNEDGYYFQTVYNPKGQIKKTSGPFRKFNEMGIIWHEYTYDEFGRIKTENAPYIDLEYAYNKCKVTVTDKLRNNVYSWKDYDALGRIIEATDEGGTVSYSYEITANKQHKITISTNGATTIIHSDLWGNRLSIEESNAGLITSTYNKFNELVKQIDARNDTISYVYDKLGRVTQKRFADKDKNLQTLTYTYDLGNKGIGKLSKIKIDGDDAETFAYDNYSRLATYLKIIGTGYRFKYSYDANGQLGTLTYPGNFAVNYKYSSTGKLDEIRRSDDNSLIYRVHSRNKYHAPMNCEYGNGLITNYKYNETGQVTGIKTESGLSSSSSEPGGDADKGGEIPVEGFTVLNYSYTYNNRGLMRSRSESIIDRKEMYTYDNLDRLTKIISSILNSSGPIPAEEQIFYYHNNGNISINSEMGIYTYDSKKPHAVILVEENPIPCNSYSVIYNSFNQPAQITDWNNRLVLFYGADQQRSKTVKYKNKNKERAQYYINKYCERTVDTANLHYYHYIYGDNGVVALHITTTPCPPAYLLNDSIEKETGQSSGGGEAPKAGISTADTMYYIHTDHLGSYCAITDAKKNVVQSNRFDPWGNFMPQYDISITNPDSLALISDTIHMGALNRGATLINFSLTPRGFTGHEHYLSFKIINMNARLYDPVISRFFSPDNFVQMPEFTQAFNRYSYCLNNPLKYIDPTGNLYNPIYNTEGKFLGTTSEGFKGEILVYSGKDKKDWESMTADAAVNVKGVSLLQDATLSAKAFSKIYTHALNKGGYNTKNLIGEAVAVNNGSDQFNNPNLTTELFSGSLKYPSKVTVNQQHPLTKTMLTTVENIWNMLGAHETVAHGLYGYGDRYGTHYKAYEYQINHSTWDAITSEYKGLVLQNYLNNLNREVPNSRSSSEYLKYYNLMNLYKK